MQKVNNLRAKLVYDEYQSGDSEIVVIENINRYLANSPSLVETSFCSRRSCTLKESTMNIPVVNINNIDFGNDFGNLEKSVMSNFPDEIRCKQCCNPYKKFERHAGNHLFIEVKSYKILQDNSLIYTPHYKCVASWLRRFQ